jgi:hypothetical protein
MLAAFILPATASAGTLTSENIDVPVGTSITETSVNVIFTNTSANSTLITCTHTHGVGTVTQNSGGVFGWTVAGGGKSSKGTGAVNADNGLPECTGSFGNAYWTWVNSQTVSNAESAGDAFRVSSGAGKVKFIIGSTTAGACEYEATKAIDGTYTTGGTEAKLSTAPGSNTEGKPESGFKLIKGGFLCPTSMALTMTFTLSTTNGVKLTIS